MTDFALLGSVGDETRLLVHRSAGYSIPIPGHPTITEPTEPLPKLDLVVTMTDLDVELGVRLDTLPSGMQPAALSIALATAFGTTRAGTAPTVRAAKADTATALYEIKGESDRLEHLTVAVKERDGGLWALYLIARYRIANVTPLQWANLRSAMFPNQHWDPAAPRASAPPLWPTASTFAMPTPALALTEQAAREASAKAADLGAMSRDVVVGLTDLLLDFSSQDQAPTEDMPQVILDMARRQLAARAPSRVAEVLTRNLDAVKTVFDFRAWCWQCISAIGNRAELVS